MSIFENVAKLIGVNLEEEFRISKYPKYFYRLTEDGLELSMDRDKWRESLCEVNVLFKSEIERLPYEPECGEIYYTYGSETFIVRQDVWTGVAVDYARKHSGIVFRNSAEAYKARPKKYKELTGMEWQGEQLYLDSGRLY